MNYRIRVAGRLGPEWSDLTGGMLVMVHEEKNGRTATDLVGAVTDEAALMGILDLLYAHRAQFVRIERVEESREAAD